MHDRILQASSPVLAGRSYLRRVAAVAGWLLVERIFRLTVGFAIGIWVARYLGPTNYGLLHFSAAIVGVLSFLSTLGLDGLAVRDMVRAPNDAGRVLGALVIGRLVGGAVLVIAATVLLLTTSLTNDHARTLVLLISLAQFMQAFDSIELWYQARVQVGSVVIAKMVTLTAMAATRVALIHAGAPVEAFAWVILAESTLLAACLAWTLRRSGLGVCAFQPDLKRVRKLLFEGWPLMLSAALTAVYLRLDQVLLGRIAGFDAVGSYAIAVRVVEATYIIPAALTAAVFPAMILSENRGKTIFAQRTRRLFGISLWTAIAIAVPLCVMSSQIIRMLVGTQFVMAGSVLAVLAWMPAFVFLSTVRHKWLIARGALRAALLVEVAICAVNLAALLALVPSQGPVGAAWAALVGQVGGTAVAALVSSSNRQALGFFVEAAMAPFLWLRDRSAQRC